MGLPAQYNSVSTMLEQIDDAINTINELNVWAKWGIGAFLTLIALGFMTNFEKGRIGFRQEDQVRLG